MFTSEQTTFNFGQLSSTVGLWPKGITASTKHWAALTIPIIPVTENDVRSWSNSSRLDPKNKKGHNLVHRSYSIIPSAWLYTYPSKKYESQLGWLFPTEWKVIKFHGSKPPTRFIKTIIPWIFHQNNYVHKNLHLLWDFPMEKIPCRTKLSSPAAVMRWSGHNLWWLGDFCSKLSQGWLYIYTYCKLPKDSQIHKFVL